MYLFETRIISFEPLAWQAVPAQITIRGLFSSLASKRTLRNSFSSFIDDNFNTLYAQIDYELNKAKKNKTFSIDVFDRYPFLSKKQGENYKKNILIYITDNINNLDFDYFTNIQLIFAIEKTTLNSKLIVTNTIKSKIDVQEFYGKVEKYANNI